MLNFFLRQSFVIVLMLGFVVGNATAQETRLPIPSAEELEPFDGVSEKRFAAEFEREEFEQRRELVRSLRGASESDLIQPAEEYYFLT